jgi:hypothetical protein
MAEFFRRRPLLPAAGDPTKYLAAQSPGQRAGGTAVLVTDARLIV